MWWSLTLLCCAMNVQASLYPDLSEFKKGLKMNAERCASAYRVQYMQVLALMEAPLHSGYDRNSKCFICCLMEKYQMLTSDGEFLDGNMKTLSSNLPQSSMKNVIMEHLDTCLREDNDDICEKCYQFTKCYYDRSKTSNKSGTQEYQHFNFYNGVNRIKKETAQW